MLVRIDIKDSSFKKYMHGSKSRSENLRDPMTFAALWMKKRTDRTFENLAHGGKFRGVNWKSFSPKTRYRHSGKPVTATSNLMQDTGRLRRSILASVGENMAILKAHRENSAAMNEMNRKYLFISAGEQKSINQGVVRYINTGVIRFGSTKR